MPATDYRRRQAVMVSAGGHALRERARTDSDPVQIRELSGMERARVRAGGPSGIRELRERFESILSELAELRAHKGDAERAELELRNELETTRTQLSKAVTQLGTTRDQLTAARADADAARTDAVASTARAQRFEDRLTEAMASAVRAEHVEAELVQAVARAKRAEAQVEIALRSKPEPVARIRAAQEPAGSAHTSPLEQAAAEVAQQWKAARPAEVEHTPAPRIDRPPISRIEQDVDDAPAERAVPQISAPVAAPAPSSPAPVAAPPAAPVATPAPAPSTPAPVTPAAVPMKDPASGAPAPSAPLALPGTEGPSEETPETSAPEAPRSTENFAECMAELRELSSGLEEPSSDGRWGVGES
jgi:hypothetical protein